MSQGGAIAIAYARRHPERVSHLVLRRRVRARPRCGARRSDLERLEAETLVNLIRVGWGRDNERSARSSRTSSCPMALPSSTAGGTSCSASRRARKVAARTLRGLPRARHQRARAALRVPTLVLHSRGDARVPFDEGRRLAALIPGARFVPLESANHVLLEGEPAWPGFLDVLHGVRSPARRCAPAPASRRARSRRPRLRVLELLARGLDNHAIALQLGKSEKTVRNQVSTIFDKLGVAHARRGDRPRDRTPASQRRLARCGRTAVPGRRSRRCGFRAACVSGPPPHAPRAARTRTMRPRRSDVSPSGGADHASHHHADRTDARYAKMHRSLQAHPLGHRPRRDPRPQLRLRARSSCPTGCRSSTSSSFLTPTSGAS